MTNQRRNINRSNKLPGTWRITIGNINSFPIDSSGISTHKIDMLRNLVVDNESDIVLISEHNRNLHNVKQSAQPSQTMKQWWPNTVVRASFLSSPNKSTFEPGGTMIVTNSKATAHTCMSGQDVQLLGRWNYISLRGKHEHYTTLISVYRPTKYQETNMRQTAYSANRRRELATNKTPEELWYTDLSDLIKGKVDAGHEVIVAGDFNDDLNNKQGPVVTFMRNLGLKEILLTAMGSRGPATHIRGTLTIDGIFATNGIGLEAGKYISFHDSPSDHRWITVDINERSLLGIKRYENCTRLTRRVTSKIPSIKVSFQHLLEKQVIMYDLPEKMNYLYEKALTSKQLEDEDVVLYEQIELRMQRAVKHADSHCRKTRRGNIPFSPMQKQLMGAIIVLRQLRLRFLLRGNKNRPRTKRIKRLINKYEYKGKSTFSNIEELNQTLSEAVNKYSSFKKESHNKRWSYLEEIAREYDSIDGKGIKHHFRILQRHEQTKEYFRMIRYSEGKLNKGGVEKIQIMQNDEIVTIYDKESIEGEIMRVNKEKLLQAYDTPMRDERISQLLGEQGDFQKWESILSGLIALPDEVDEGLEVWYKFVTSTKKYDITEFIWTTEEYCKSWNKMKEDRTTLPGIQVAHMKCLDPSTQAADIMSKLSLIPLLTGYSPKTWRQGIDSMIPKKVADLRPEKLRLILLMDARFNHNNKLIGKKMMEYGEKFGLLAPEQYGSRKHKSAIDHATNKRFTMDIIRQAGIPAIYVANDAKSCYDRIILLVAYITMRNYGIPALVAQSTISTILNMKHYVRTSYGDSETFYGGENWEVKPHGCGQGNGYGPALWACISSPLLQILREKGYGTVIRTPLTDFTIHLGAFSFVDDTDIIQTGTQETGTVSEADIGKLYDHTQQAIQLWSNTLAATGGALEPSKTFYVPIIPVWRGAYITVSKDNSDRQISLQSRDGMKSYLLKKDPKHSFFSLGIWQSPSGDEIRQVQHLKDIIRNWGEATTLRKMTWQHARIAVKATVGRTLHYPLLATAMSDIQCRSLQREILHQTLGKMGVVRTAPVVIATAPVSLGGLGIISIETVQLIRHVSLILQHGQSNVSTTGKLLLSTIEYNALETGYSGDPLGIPPVQYTTKNTWIGNTLQFMHKYDIRIQSSLSGLAHWTTNDLYIMEILSNYGSGTTMAIINKVRMYLGVVTVSDLVTADGKFYDKKSILGERSNSHPTPSRFRYGWPALPSPTRTEKAIWCSALVLTLQLNIDHPRPVHEDIQWEDDAFRSAIWIYSDCNGMLYQRLTSEHSWDVWRPAMENRRNRTRRSASYFVCSQQNVSQISGPMRLASIEYEGTRVRLLTTSRTVHHQSLPAGNLQGTPMTPARAGNIQEVFKDNILMHNGIIYSDGSYENGRSSFAWAAQPPVFDTSITAVDFSSFWWNADLVHGDSDEQNSYRAELGGILDAILHTNALCRDENISQGSCTIFCDSKGALAASFGSRQPTPNWASFDLVHSIKQALDVSPIQWKCVHVKGHQDKSTNFEHLDPSAQGNVIVDHLASKCLREAGRRPVTPTVNWKLTVNGKLISGNFDKRLYKEIYRPKMMEKWTSLFKLGPQIINACDWTSFFRSFSGHPPHKHINIVKFNARVLPVGTNLKRRRHSDTAECSHCHVEETHQHLIQCLHPEIESAFTYVHAETRDWLLKNTSASIAEDLLYIINYFRESSGGGHPSAACNTRTRLQISIGQDAFFAGLWLEQWRIDQAQYHLSIGSRRDSRKWICHIINKIQSIPLIMWQHRNEIRHKDIQVRENERQQDELNRIIDEIFSSKPHERLMRHCDNLYFKKHSKETIREMKVHRKSNWITGAKLILKNYERIDTAQAARFTSYFQWDPG